MCPQNNAEEINEQVVATAQAYPGNLAGEREALSHSRAWHARFYRTPSAPIAENESMQEAMLRASSSNFNG